MLEISNIFLGIEVAQSKEEVVISQRKYALDILKETDMIDCKLVDCPLDPNLMEDKEKFFRSRNI